MSYFMVSTNADQRPGWSWSKVAALAGLCLVIAASLALLGCGDVFRPVANPQLKPGGDPAAVRLAIVVSQGAPGQFGAATQVNVSGDTNSGNFPLGHNPVYAAIFAARVWIANQSDDSISFYSTSDVVGTQASSITLPAGSSPGFMTGAGLTLYVANSGNNTVSAISTPISALSATINVGSTPVALAATPGSTKLYCVNKGSNNVSVISTADFSQIGSPIAVGASPVWAVMRPDGAALYVVNQGSGTVSVISTSTDTVVATLSVGTLPNNAVYDSSLQRLYVTNPGSNSISVFNASAPVPTLLNTVTVGAAPVRVTALADGSRFYTANSGCSDIIDLQNCSGSTVSVVDAGSFQVRKTITVGTTPVWIDAASDGTKVFVTNRDSNNISDIRTLDDTVVVTLASGAPRPLFVVNQ